jgi:chitinase
LCTTSAFAAAPQTHHWLRSTKFAIVEVNQAASAYNKLVTVHRWRSRQRGLEPLVR